MRVPVRDVELRDIGAGARASVGDREGYGHVPVSRCLRRDGQIGVLKRGVAQAEAERERRLYLRTIEAAVSDKDAFLVFDTLIGLRIVAVVDGIVFPTAFERSGEASARIEVAE